MPAFSSISNSKLHCCVVILILFIVVFMTLPLWLINVANQQFKRNLNVTCPKNESAEGSPVQCPGESWTACPSCPGICIHQNHLCDGITDCPDQWDESASHCYDTNGVMGNFYKRIVDKSKTENLVLAKPESCDNETFFANLCNCNMSEVNVIICEDLGLRSLPTHLKETVFKIRISNNSISSLDGVNWPRELTSLVMWHNDLTYIGPRAFKSAPNLSKLYLNYNNISDIHDDAFESLTRLDWFQVESNRLTTFRTRVLRHTPAMATLRLNENQIDLPEDTQFSLGPNIKELLLDNNQISAIRRAYFSNMSRLSELSLAHNQISYIEKEAFDGNYELLELNLSFNKITVIERRIFAHRLNIQRLYLSGNPIGKGGLTADSFRDLMELKSLELTHIEFYDLKSEYLSFLRHLDFIYFEKFRYCQFAGQKTRRGRPVCRPVTDGLSSMEDLLAIPVLKDAVWIVAMVCSVGNVFVLVWRSVSTHEDRSLSLFIKTLSIADLMMGAYLGTIGWQDSQFRNNFRNNAIDWMSSWKCSALGFLAILSSELSVFILLIITVERYRSIMSNHTLEEAAKKRRARICVALAWLFSFLMALYPLFQWLVRKSDFYATNGLCLPLHIDQPFGQGWQYSAFIYLGVNFVAVLVIIGLYARMYTIIIDGRQTSRPALLKADKREDAILAIRFFFIVVTDCMCWIPIVVIKTMALFNVSISASIYGWLVVFIIPINSALNPIIYTLAAPTSLRSALCRVFRRMCISMDRLTGHCSDYSSIPARSLGSGQKINGRRRRKMDSNSTTTCDTFNISMTSHSKVSFDSALLDHHDHATTTSQPSAHQHQSHSEEDGKKAHKANCSKESSFSSTASSSPLKASGEVERGQIDKEIGNLSSKLNCLTSYKPNSIKHRVLSDPDSAVLDSPLAVGLAADKKNNSLSDRIESITSGIRSILRFRQRHSSNRPCDSDDRIASNLIEQSVSSSSSERGSSRSSCQRPDCVDEAAARGEMESVKDFLPKKTRTILTSSSADGVQATELELLSDTVGIDEPRSTRVTKSSIVHFQQDQ